MIRPNWTRKSLNLRPGRLPNGRTLNLTHQTLTLARIKALTYLVTELESKLKHAGALAGRMANAAVAATVEVRLELAQRSDRVAGAQSLAETELRAQQELLKACETSLAELDQRYQAQTAQLAGVEAERDQVTFTPPNTHPIHNTQSCDLVNLFFFSRYSPRYVTRYSSSRRPGSP